VLPLAVPQREPRSAPDVGAMSAPAHQSRAALATR